VGLLGAGRHGVFYKNLLRPALEAVGLPASRPATKDAPAVQGVTLRDLRHTFATLQLSAGVHFMQVSNWPGHSSFTLNLPRAVAYSTLDGGWRRARLPVCAFLGCSV
jgi:integrase